jgi:GT2 family glycosyltransferase
MEDFDLGLRANRMGWKCLYIPEAKCYHPTSSTINKFHQPKAVQIIAKRNGLLLHQLHLNGIPLILFWGRNAIQLILRLFKADLVWYHAFFAFCSKLRELNSIKRKQQFNYSISEIVHSLKSEIPRDAQLF